MLMREAFLAEAIFPTGRKAVKASNSLTKNYGAERSMSLGSNPYSNVQSFNHSISKTGADRLHKHLTGQGWKHETRPVYGWHDKEGKDAPIGEVHDYQHAMGGHVVLGRYHGKDTVGGKPFNRVTVHGDKKAKRTTIPYYD